MIHFANVWSHSSHLRELWDFFYWNCDSNPDFSFPILGFVRRKTNTWNTAGTKSLWSAAARAAFRYLDSRQLEDCCCGQG
jgi:hypothetical protein